MRFSFLLVISAFSLLFSQAFSQCTNNTCEVFPQNGACCYPAEGDPGYVPCCCTTIYDNQPFDEVPIDVLGTGTYTPCSGNSHVGGLYYNGSNVRPQIHTNHGINLANSIIPRDTAGNPDPVNGKVGFIALGPSVAREMFDPFIDRVNDLRAAGITRINPCLHIVNGSLATTNIDDLIWDFNIHPNPSTPTTYWEFLIDGKLIPGGLTPKQVQVIWFKYPANVPFTLSFEDFRDSSQVLIRMAMEQLYQRFPNLKIVYLTSMSYKGYMCTPNNPVREPAGYWSGWVMKKLITEQIQNSMDGSHPELEFRPANNPHLPWLSWGPYLWSNGLQPNTFGVKWQCPIDYDDNQHPSPRGERMVATTLLRFFYRDETAKIWFRNSSAFNCDRCNDGVQDYGETGVDCGGPCPPCPSSIILNRLGQFAKEEMKLYPNPATTQVTIELPWFMDETDRVKLRVFDIYGKLAKVIDVTSSTHTFSTADLKNGSYLYDVISSEEKLFSGQFMVVKSH